MKFITGAGADRLGVRRARLHKELREILARDKVVSQGGGMDQLLGYFDSCEHEERIRIQQIAEIDAILSDAEIVPMPAHTNVVAIGHVVTIIADDGAGETPRKLIIGGHQETDLTAEPQMVSYDTPLVQPMMNKRVGAIVLAQLPRGDVEIEILAIEIPQSVPAKRWTRTKVVC